ncbi:MAG TPA: lysylphosphatidylglycerol synthase transmembrane domain-containing protein [Gaiellaceae bacterium]|nr:lysylphosphatidylglycerol synthase transmembrane domain-containing protein [Gaiellaceae bacterium]
MKSRGLRLLAPVVALALAASLVWWRGPDWSVVRDTFTVVRWPWVVTAVALNLLSIVVRSLAWNTVIRKAIAAPRPGIRVVFSAFSVGLFANAVLPGRVGEVARAAVLARRLPGRKGVWATLIGTVFAHRMFDLFPTIGLVVWVVLGAKLPHWALMTIVVVLGIGIALFAFAIVGAREHGSREQAGRVLEGQLGRVRSLITRARVGLAVMREPVAAATAATFQFLGWFFQLLAVYAAMHAFRIYEPIVAAALVLLMMNVVTVFPFWPGNIGLVQAAVAVSLAQYGVDYGKGFAYGIGLQLIEASVGIGIGTVFLAREGLSYAMLKDFEQASEDEEPASVSASTEEPARV